MYLAKITFFSYHYVIDKYKLIIQLHIVCSSKLNNFYTFLNYKIFMIYIQFNCTLLKHNLL